MKYDRKKILELIDKLGTELSYYNFNAKIVITDRYRDKGDQKEIITDKDFEVLERILKFCVKGRTHDEDGLSFQKMIGGQA